MRATKNRCSHWLRILVVQIPDGTVRRVEMNRRTSETLAASWRTFKRAKHPRIDAATTRASAALSIVGYLSQAWQPGREEALSHCAALN